MAATLLFELADYIGARVLFDRDRVYRLLPQQHEFKLIDGVVHLDQEVGHAVAFVDVTADQWWCKAHIPGRPILPGVLMLEAAAQLAALMERYAPDGFDGFVGYGGVDDCKFRRTVEPPARMWLLCQRIESRSRRIVCKVQGAVDADLVFEATVTGLVIPATKPVDP